MYAPVVTYSSISAEQQLQMLPPHLRGQSIASSSPVDIVMEMATPPVSQNHFSVDKAPSISPESNLTDLLNI